MKSERDTSGGSLVSDKFKSFFEHSFHIELASRTTTMALIEHFDEFHDMRHLLSPSMD
jgi:hypothetical protein